MEREEKRKKKEYEEALAAKDAYWQEYINRPQPVSMEEQPSTSNAYQEQYLARQQQQGSMEQQPSCSRQQQQVPMDQQPRSSRQQQQMPIEQQSSTSRQQLPASTPRQDEDLLGRLPRAPTDELPYLPHAHDWPPHWDEFPDVPKAPPGYRTKAKPPPYAPSQMDPIHYKR
jgi:hypothetical protein